MCGLELLLDEATDELEPVEVWRDVLPVVLVSADATAPLVEEVEVLPVALSAPLVDEDELPVLPDAELMPDDVSWLATDELVEGVVLVEEVEELPVLAKPEVLPVALSELLELADGEEAADEEVLPVLDEVSLLAIDELVEGVVLVDEVEELPVLANPLVLPVALRESLELVDGDEAEEEEVLPVLEPVSLLATEELVEGEALEEPVDELPVLANPLVLPVALNELLEELDGELAADESAEVDEEPEAVWLLAIEPLVDGEVLVEEVEELPVLANPLVLPVADNDELELEDGDEDAAVEFATLMFVLLFVLELLATLLDEDGELDEAVVSPDEPVIADVLPVEDGELLPDVP